MPTILKPHLGQESAPDFVNLVKSARRIWHQYIRDTRSEFGIIAPIVDEYFAARENQPFFLLLNVIAPVALSYAFGITSDRDVRSITLGHLYLDHFTQILDDATDRGHPDPRSLHLSHLLLMRGLEQYEVVGQGDPSGMDRVREQVERVMSGERALWRHKSVLAPFDASDFEALSERGGIVQCVPILLGHLTKDKKREHQVRAGLSAIVIGIQLCDDLIDWETDLTEGTMTLPLVRALQSLAEEPTHSPAKVAGALIRAEIFAEIGRITTSYIEKGQRLLLKADVVGLDHAFNSLQRAAVQLGAQTAKLKSREQSFDENELLEKLRKILNSADLRLQH